MERRTIPYWDIVKDTRGFPLHSIQWQQKKKKDFNFFFSFIRGANKNEKKSRERERARDTIKRMSKKNDNTMGLGRREKKRERKKERKKNEEDGGVSDCGTHSSGLRGRVAPSSDQLIGRGLVVLAFSALRSSLTGFYRVFTGFHLVLLHFTMVS